MRPQNIDRKTEQSAKPEIVNEKRDGVLKRAIENGEQVRVVMYVEVGDLSPTQISTLVQKLGEQMDKSNHIHYLVPMRNGKLTCDILFEHEILSMVNQICEIKDGVIALKNGARDIKIIRETVY